MIGHMKSDGLLGKNWLKGELGDAMHAILCGAGHNLRLILAHLRVLLLALLAWLLLGAPRPNTSCAEALRPLCAECSSIGRQSELFRVD